MKLNHLVSIGLFLTIAACGSHSFKSTPGVQTPAQKSQDAVPAPVKVLPPKVVTKTQEFSLIKSATPIDMLWVIDNSGSMSEEVAQVRKNFEAFTKSISDRADLKLTLISLTEEKSSKFGISLSSMASMAGHAQINSEVSSWNLLDMAAAATCSVESTEISPNGSMKAGDKLCGLPAISTSPVNSMHINEVRGEFKSRLREGAKRVYIFVSDDNENWMITSDKFISATQSDPLNTSVYAFRGDKNKSGCSIAAKGASYEALASSTGGAVFDICESDWTANFASLSTSILKLLSHNFVITSKTDVNIVKVTLAGVDLTQDQYTVGKNQITLKDDSLVNKDGALVITYEVLE